jgi:hypothetical protein
MKIPFPEFLKRFPEVQPPVTLRDDTNRDFEANDPLSLAMIDEYIGFYEPTQADDMTEYMAGFSLPKQENYQAVVYWRAALLNYDYVLATYNSKTGKMIDKKSIAGTKVVGDQLRHTVATIDETNAIFIAEGTNTEGGDYEANSTTAKRFQILESGLIEQEY